MMNYTENPTLLTPQETQFYLKVFLVDTKHINNPDYESQFKCEFIPYDADEYTKLETRMDEMIDCLNTRRSCYDDRKFKPRYTSTKNSLALFFSQNFTPKVNIPFDDTAELEKTASLNLYLRDAPDGSVYLNCSYVDILSNELPTADASDDDW